MKRLKFGEYGLRRICGTALFLSLSLLGVQANAGTSCAPGGTCTQTIELNPGWNSIYVKVRPDTPDTEVVFADLLDGAGPLVSSVWTWVAQRSQLDYISNPDTDSLLSEPGWLRFFPEGSDEAFLTNLFAISANRAYLVKLEGEDPATLEVVGSPVLPRFTWQPNTLNHVGFYIDEIEGPPSFTQFFAGSSAHSGQPIYALDNVTGEWQPIAPETDMESDRAYWIYSRGSSDYVGPLALEEGGRLTYGSVLESLAMSLTNLDEANHDLSLLMLANGDPMRVRNPDPNAVDRWQALPYESTVEAGATERIILGVRRRDFSEAEYNEVLEIRVPGISRWLIPVTARAPDLASLTRGGQMLADWLRKIGSWLVPAAHAQVSNTGLWTGVVEINQVTQLHNNYRRECINAAHPDLEIVTSTDPLTFSDPDMAYIVRYDPVFATYRVRDDIYIGLDPTVYPDVLPPDPKPEDWPEVYDDLCTDLEGHPDETAEPASVLAPASPFQFRILLHQDDLADVRLLKGVIQMWNPAVTSTDEQGVVTIDEPGYSVLLVDENAVPAFDGVTLRDGTAVGVRTSSIAYDFDGNTLLMDSGEIGSGDLVFTLVMGQDHPTNPFRHKYHKQHKADVYEVTRTMTLSFDGLDESELGSVYTGTYRELVAGLNYAEIEAAGEFTLRRVSVADQLEGVE